MPNQIIARAVSEHVLVLRTCNADMSSRGGFVWPESGRVEAPDWDATPECGRGLHGLLWGEGDGDLLEWASDAKWLVVKVLAADIVDLRGKVKFPRGEVVFCGERTEATQYIAMNGGAGRAIVGHTATAGNWGTATVGYSGAATAGDRGTATAGDLGTATAGDLGKATAGNLGKATAGNWGTATAGNEGTATAGYRGTATAGEAGAATAGEAGTATAGDYGTVTAGDFGIATAGRYGTATAGDFGTATAASRGTATAASRGTAAAGDYGVATAGYRGIATVGGWGTATAGNEGTATAGYRGIAAAGRGGCISILHWDGEGHRRRCAEVDGEKVKAGVRYRLNSDGEFEEASELQTPGALKEVERAEGSDLRRRSREDSEGS